MKAISLVQYWYDFTVSLFTKISTNLLVCETNAGTYSTSQDGNVLTRTSARGVVASYAYDAAGRPTGVSFSDNATSSVSYTYDRAGQVVSVTDAAGTRALAYDAFGNCLSETVPQVAGKTVVRIFDILNRRTGLALGTDLSAAYAYDAFGRVSSISSGVNTVAFDYRTHGYALAGKRWLRNDAAVASTAAQYDVWGNITDISFGAPGDLHSLGYLYDIANRRTQASLPDGTKWLYGYDRLSQVVSGERVDAATNEPVANGSFRYAYDGIGNRVFSQDGSSANLLGYSANNLNQYVSIFSPGVIPIRGRADADAKVAVTTTVGGASTTYVPERDGQGFSIDIPVDNSSGAVTAAVQVDALRHDGTLDVDLHRRLSGDYTVPAATPEVPTYDADGNLLSYDGWTYTWNAEDRLVSASKGTTRLEFAYDYLGRRFEKKVYESNVLTRHQLFVYDGFKQIAEYDALDSNALANTYIWQPVGLDVPLLRNGQEFCVSDANKNIVALIDTTGSITDTYIYDPFGNCAHTGTSANPFRFSSEYYDEETGLVYYNFRYFSSELGRWLSRDPIGEEGGLNLFCILRNSTISLYDYWGLVCYCGKDITEALNKHLSDIEKLFNEGKFTDSMNHGMQWGFLGLGTDGWDFAVLYDNSIGKTSELVSKHGKNKTCAQTVSVAGHCYRIAEVNYLLWGKLMQLRNRKYNKIYEDGTFGLIRVYRSFFGIISKIQTGEAIQGGTDGRLFWATVGLNSQRSLPENIDDIHYQYPDTAIFVPYQYPDTGFFVPSDMYGFIGYGSYITLPGRVITAKDVSKSECVVDESDVFNGSLEPWIHDKNTPGGYFRL